jgi:hypothetical protein
MCPCRCEKLGVVNHTSIQCMLEKEGSAVEYSETAVDKKELTSIS